MRKWIPYLLIIAAVVASIVVYPRMPERVPTHWNMAGEVDGWSSRFFAAWLSPVMMAVMLVILRALPHIDPRRANYAKFSGMYEALIMVTMAFMLGIHLMLLALATGSQVPVARVIPAAVGVFFMIIGAMLPRAHPNWFVGIRTPWTLTSDASWQKTHRLGGALFIASGLLAVLAAVAVPRLASWVLLAAGLVTVGVVFFYSYVTWKQDKGRNAAGQ
jgi:uncharacterized membrane protein